MLSGLLRIGEGASRENPVAARVHCFEVPPLGSVTGEVKILALDSNDESVSLGQNMAVARVIRVQGNRGAYFHNIQIAMIESFY